MKINIPGNIRIAIFFFCIGVVFANMIIGIPQYSDGFQDGKNACEVYYQENQLNFIRLPDNISLNQENKTILKKELKTDGD